MPSIKTPFYFLEAITLDIIAIPGQLTTKKANAKWHLKFVCPLCSKHRKSFRYGKNKKECMWHDQWKKKNYDFSRTFGIINWLKYYLGIKADLKKYEGELK